MRLILLRHGLAESSSQHIPDAQRHLTNKGKEELNDYLPALSHYLDQLDHCTIYSSPLTRASETADILVRHMPGADYDFRAFLATGDKKALLDTLHACDKGDTLVLIGHEPYLSEWTEYLTGRATTFDKGSFKFIYLDPYSPREAVLFTRPELNERHYLLPLEMPVSVGMHLILRRQHDDIVTHREYFLDHPDDASALHMLRVSIRIQRSLFTYVNEWADPKAYRAAQKAYRKIFGQLTHLREMDVLIKTIHDSRNWELEPLVLPLMTERNEEALRLSDKLSSKESQLAYAKAFDLLRKALLTVKTEATIAESARKQMDRRFKKICDDKANLDPKDLESIHQLRIHCKTYRYLYERFAALASHTVAQRYLLARSLHRLLGDYNDAFYNRQALEDLFSKEDILENPLLGKALRKYQRLSEENAQKQALKIKALIVEENHFYM